MTPEGLIVARSDFDPKETMDRLTRAVTHRGAAVLARIDHAGAAASVGMTLRPTEVLVFGNPRAGTPLMQASETMGIDLPLKALAWRDEAGRTQLGYNDPVWLARRHGAEAANAQVLRAMADFLAAAVKEAVTREAS
jgi:uncharacterized protein (DUF302 family)